MLDEHYTAMDNTGGLLEPERESDLWFNPFRYPGSERAWSVVHEVVRQVEQHGNRKRARKRKDLQVLRDTLVAVATNIIYHHLSGSPGHGVPVPRGKQDLGGSRTRYRPFAFPRSFPQMLDALSELGFATQDVGDYSGLPGRSKRTTVTAGPKLTELVEQHEITFADIEVSDDEEIIILKRTKQGGEV